MFVFLSGSSEHDHVVFDDVGIFSFVYFVNVNIVILAIFPSLLDDVFHNLGKEDHRQPTPTTPRNGSTGLTSLPPLSGPPLPPAPTAHLPIIGSQPFPKMATPAPDFADSHQGHCLPPTEPLATSMDGPISAPPSVCRQVCCLISQERLFILFLFCRSNPN